MNLQIVRYSELKGKYGIPWSRMHIDRLERDGKFPKRVRLGPGTVGWVEAELASFVTAAMDARGAELASAT